MFYWPMPTHMQATRHLVLSLGRFVDSLGFAARYRLESICCVALDLCIHWFRRHRFLSSARVVPCCCAVRTLTSGHHPISAIPT